MLKTVSFAGTTSFSLIIKRINNSSIDYGYLFFIFIMDILFLLFFFLIEISYFDPFKLIDSVPNIIYKEK